MPAEGFQFVEGAGVEQHRDALARLVLALRATVDQPHLLVPVGFFALGVEPVELVHPGFRVRRPPVQRQHGGGLMVLAAIPTEAAPGIARRAVLRDCSHVDLLQLARRIGLDMHLSRQRTDLPAKNGVYSVEAVPAGPDTISGPSGMD